MVIRRDPWKQGKGKSQWSSRRNKRIQGTTGQSALSQPAARLCNSHWENLMATGTWTPGTGQMQRGDRAPRVPPEGTSTPGPGSVWVPWEESGRGDGASLGPAVASQAGIMMACTQVGPPASLMDHETSSCWFWETYCIECCHLIKEYFYLRGPRAFPGVKSLQGLQQYPAQLPCTLLLALMAAKWPSHPGLPICCLVSGCHIFLYQL